MALSNGLNPNLNRLSFNSNTAFITGGTATGHDAITAETGTPTVSSVYLSSSGSGEVWVFYKKLATQNMWTLLTLP